MTTNYIDQLDSINRAIAAIESGAQEYGIGSRSVKRADLGTLYAERRRLEGIINSSAYGTTLANINRRW